MINYNIVLLLILLIIILFLQQVPYSTSTSYNVYNYDLATPMFTPDGLLKQVEYASLTPSHSTPMIIVPIRRIVRQKGHDGRYGDQGLMIVASMSCHQLDNDNDDNDNVSNHNNTNNNNGKRGQSRIIPIPISAPTSSSTTSNILIGINGLLPDCISLLQHARNELHSYHKTYGIHRLHYTSTPTKILTNSPIMTSSSSSSSSVAASLFTSSSSCALRFATSIADKCQRHSFGGGLRPFGSQIVVCAVDDDYNLNVYVTSPSGNIDHYSYTCCHDYFLDISGSSESHDSKDKNNNNNNNNNNSNNQCLIQDVIVVGGEEKIKKQIRKRIRNGINCESGHEMKEIIQSIVNALCQGLKKNQQEDNMITSFAPELVEQLDLFILGSRNCQSLSKDELIRIMNDTKNNDND